MIGDVASSQDAKFRAVARSQWLPWLAIGVSAGAVFLLQNLLPWLHKYPADWVIPAADWINAAMDWLVELLKPATRVISTMVEWPMVALRDFLQWLPWPVTVLAVVGLALHAAGRGLAVLCLAAMLYIALSGYWHQAMNTMALVGVAVPLSLLVGLTVGIAAQRTRVGSRVVPPALDLMQTMPTFAYLIPLLVLFGFGPVVGLIASAVYACPPMVRNVLLGLQRVPSEVAEAARISGASRYQQLFWVELPAALAQIKIGINQTIMAALSMVIIASVIGGFDDIGWEVLSTMRKARFGDSLLAGLVIVLIAVVMDRISAAYSVTGQTQQAGRQDHRRRWRWFIGALVIGCGLLKLLAVDIAVDDPDWTPRLAAWLNTRLDAIVVNYGDTLTSIKNTIFYYYLLPLRIGFSQSILPFTWGFEFTDGMRQVYWAVTLATCSMLTLRFRWRAAVTLAALAYVAYFGLTGASWIVFAAAATTLAWQVGGANVGLFALLSIAFIVLTGMWERAMLSVYLCGAAALMSFALGAVIGVWAASSATVSAVVRPIADTFQTIPLFVFLIPVLMFFQVGEFTALLAIIAYAFVPAIRYTESGLRQVSPELIEVANAQGCTPWQTFWQVKLPLAMPSIMVGLNQTVMFAFAMLVIAALVGTTGLGQQIFLALSAADTGLGMIAGLSMAFLAMITDRIMQSWAATKFAGVHSRPGTT